jgi:hypothetical protein
MDVVKRDIMLVDVRKDAQIRNLSQLDQDLPPINTKGSNTQTTSGL